METYLVLVGTHAEVADGLAGVLGATEQQGVGTSGLLEGQLVEGLDGAAGSEDASTGGGGETQSGDVHLGDLEQTDIIGDGADNDDGLLLVAVLEVGLDAREGDGRAVDAGHKETAQDNLVEGSVGTACEMRRVWLDLINCESDNQGLVSGICKTHVLTGQEAVQLDQELQVDIVALGGLAVGAAHVVAVEIDTYKQTRVSSSAFGSGMLKKKDWQALEKRWERRLSTGLDPFIFPQSRQSLFADPRSEAGPAHTDRWQRPHVRRPYRSKTLRSTCIQKADFGD